MAHTSTDPAATRDADFRNRRPAPARASMTGIACRHQRLENELLRADEGDLLEQRTALPVDDADDYPYTRTGQVAHV